MPLRGVRMEGSKVKALYILGVPTETLRTLYDGRMGRGPARSDEDA